MTTTSEPTTALARPEPSKLAQLTGYTDSQINLFRQTVALGANIVEVAWYLYNAKQLGFEPNLKQIYLIKYSDKKPADIVVGIDGYRKQAADSGEYAGSDEAVFEYEDVGQPDGAPSKATVTVYRMVQGQRVPFTASVRWTEFYPGNGPSGEQYRKRPHNQLAVRAESHALRKAFPHQTERLDVRHPLPADWEDAASRYTIEQQTTPQRQKALAGTYDKIMPSEAEWDRGAVPGRQDQVEDTAGPANTSPPQGDRPTSEETSPASSDASADAQALSVARETNSELLESAQQIGVKGLRALAARPESTITQITEMNEELAARIRSRNGDLDAQLAGDQGRPV
jgi:phage recombination protein Bet